MKKDYAKISLKLHKKYRGKFSITPKVRLENKEDLSVWYTPGVAEPCLRISKNPELAYDYTIKGNTIAVITDGTRVLGLGNIGALAGLPVMEGKCALFKKFGNVNAFPLCIDTHDPDEFIETVRRVAPVFGGINLEDISVPNCFYIEEKLKELLDIPVFHDDQHGTATVILAGLINALKVVKKNPAHVRVVISGAGAAGIAAAYLLLHYGVKHIILTDRHGMIHQGRDNLLPYKKKIAKLTNRESLHGSLEDAMKNADVFIGLSAPNILTPKMIKSMARDPVIFALSNPAPEIMPDVAKKAGAKVIATGRSDFPNQINNVLAFPGVFRGALDARVRYITDDMKIAAASALARLVKNPTPEKIIPGVFEKGVAKTVAKAMMTMA